MLDQQTIDEVMESIVKTLREWIGYSLKVDEGTVTSVENRYNLILKPKINNFKYILKSKKSYLLNNYPHLKNELNEIVSMLDKLESWETEVNNLWLKFYEELSKIELNSATEYSILDVNGSGGNLIRYLLKRFEKDPVRAVIILTSPAIEYRAKVLFMPILYTHQKLKIKLDTTKIEDEIINAIIEEELHKVVTKLEGDGMSCKLDRVMYKIWYHLKSGNDGN